MKIWILEQERLRIVKLSREDNLYKLGEGGEMSGRRYKIKKLRRIAKDSKSREIYIHFSDREVTWFPCLVLFRETISNKFCDMTFTSQDKVIKDDQSKDILMEMKIQLLYKEWPFNICMGHKWSMISIKAHIAGEFWFRRFTRTTHGGVRKSSHC